MSTSLTADVIASISATLTKTSDLSLAVDTLGDGARAGQAFANGTGQDQADIVWADQRTVTAGADDDIDVAGVLTDVFGATITAARIRAIFIKTANGATANLEIGAAAANPIATLFGATNDKLVVRLGGGFLLLCAPDATGYAIVAGSADTLRVSHDGTTSDDVTYNIVILAASA